MSNQFSIFLLTACLCVIPAAHSAEVPEITMKMNLKGYYQAKLTNSKNKVNGRVKTYRLDSKQLIKLIGKQTGRKFPGGARLMVNEFGNCQVADNKGNTIFDATEFVQVKFLTAGELYNGELNTQTGRRNSRNYYQIALKLNLEGLQGLVIGVADEKMNVSVPDRDGVQVTHRKIKSDVNGKGEINGGTGFYEGNLNLYGRTAEIR